MRFRNVIHDSHGLARKLSTHHITRVAASHVGWCLGMLALIPHNAREDVPPLYTCTERDHCEQIRYGTSAATVRVQVQGLELLLGIMADVYEAAQEA